MPNGHTRTPGVPHGSAGGPEPDHLPGGAVEVNGSYAGEWALFEHYCAATEQTALPASAATVEAFLTAVPGRPATLARRRRAIAAAHRRAGLSAEHLQLDTSGACSAAFFERQQRRDGAGDLIAVCPTRGWPTGLAGRRDGFLVVLIEVLGHTRERASRLTPAEITLDRGGATIAGRAVPEGTDPRSCPGCAVGRWLEVCDLGDGLGQAIGRRLLTSTAPATPDSPHVHLPGHQRWRQTRWLMTGVDQHGWIRDDDPLSPRAITGRLRDLRLRVGRAGQLAEAQVPEVGVKAL